MKALHSEERDRFVLGAVQFCIGSFGHRNHVASDAKISSFKTWTPMVPTPPNPPRGPCSLVLLTCH